MKDLSDVTKKKIASMTGIPYDTLIEMDSVEIAEYIESKTGKKIGYEEPLPQFMGSGDDSVLIDLGNFTTIEEIDKEMDKIIKRKR